MATFKLDSQASKLPTLSGIGNYATWAGQIRNFLTVTGHWDLVNGTSTRAQQLTAAGAADPALQRTWEANDRQAQAIIGIYIHPNMQHLLKHAYVAVGNVTHPSLCKDLWDTLQSMYAPTGVVGQFHAFSEVMRF